GGASRKLEGGAGREDRSRNSTSSPDGARRARRPRNRVLNSRQRHVRSWINSPVERRRFVVEVAHALRAVRRALASCRPNIRPFLLMPRPKRLCPATLAWAVHARPIWQSENFSIRRLVPYRRSENELFIRVAKNFPPLRRRCWSRRSVPIHRRERSTCRQGHGPRYHDKSCCEGNDVSQLMARHVMTDGIVCCRAIHDAAAAAHISALPASMTPLGCRSRFGHWNRIAPSRVV